MTDGYDDVTPEVARLRLVWLVVCRMPEGPFRIATADGEPILLDHVEAAALLAETLLARGADQATPLQRTIGEVRDAFDAQADADEEDETDE